LHAYGGRVGFVAGTGSGGTGASGRLREGRALVGAGNAGSFEKAGADLKRTDKRGRRKTGRTGFRFGRKNEMVGKTMARLLAGVLVVGALGLHMLATGASAEEAKKQITIGFIPGIASDPFFKAMELGARNKAKELGVNLMWQGSASDYSPQTEMPFVDAALTNGVDALILVPTDPNAMQPAVTRAESMKIPVITVDTTVADQSYLTSFITGDNIDGGRQAAETLAKLIGDKGKVFIMSGSPSATTDVAREKGFREAMKQHPSIEVIGIEYATILLKYPDLAGIFALDGTSGTGTVAALRNANKAGEVKLVGYDAYKAEVDALKEGVFTALVAQQPAKEADLALQFAYDKITGKDVGAIQKAVVIPNVVLTKDNLAETEKYMYVQ
jgi:ribose transport system substrate-binding protein